MMRFGWCWIERNNTVFRCEFRAEMNRNNKADAVEIEAILQDNKQLPLPDAEKTLDIRSIEEEITGAIGRPLAESRITIGWLH